MKLSKLNSNNCNDIWNIKIVDTSSRTLLYYIDLPVLRNPYTAVKIPTNSDGILFWYGSRNKYDFQLSLIYEYVIQIVV